LPDVDEVMMMEAAAETVYLRYAGCDDASALATLRTASMRENEMLAESDAPAFEARARRSFARMLRDERLVGWVLVAGARIVGSACIVLFERLPYPGTSQHAEVAGVYVDPGFRGRGFARELVREAIAGASAFGVRRIFIAPTDAMRGFYRTLGFESCGWLANEATPRKAGAPPFLDRAGC
jgi:GNAT superfamily N-acetyltransferase